ncbi:prepilin peptidase [Candidatus Daviesbacteria bacterium]|nr:prepilin peptidase [Candidatus Daviesbacteria bacterium]
MVSIWQITLGFIIGLCLGSFTKAVSDRIVLEEGLGGRSHCPKCHHTLAWYDLIPILSFFMLGGKCRYCDYKIPQTNLWTEIILGLLTAAAVALSPWSPELIFRLFIITVAAIVFLIDFQIGIIPDKIVLPAVLITVIYLAFSALSTSWAILWWALVCAVAAAAAFVLLILITRGRGMGWGDVKYVFLLGLGLGFPNTLVALFLAFLSGAMVALALIAFGKKRFGQTIPFGPFLSLGTIMALFWGQYLISWYLLKF